MSDHHQEPGLTSRIAERPALELGRLRETKARALLYRFGAGALTSVVAGLITLAAGPSAGGIFLAFPAILAASLTLIKKQEDAQEAREDARGAVMGGFALAIFAATAALTLNRLPGAAALALATLAWFLAAGLGYLLVWFRRPPRTARRRRARRSAAPRSGSSGSASHSPST